eukprot:scaffold28642_cov36-Phaeocystis_antarctica.AAC.1
MRDSASAWAMAAAIASACAGVSSPFASAVQLSAYRTPAASAALAVSSVALLSSEMAAALS